jgi:TRAP-type C4-dicarboxylate transport system substrate-binding protein
VRTSLHALFASLLALSVLCSAPRSARADEPVALRVATLAPAGSAWGKVFKAWQKGIHDRSHGALEVQIFYGTTQGDELAMVGKIRTRQLDGAVITATGLAQIDPNVLVFQMPGLFRDWATLDAARDAMRPMLDAAMEKQGFRVAGWGDIGIAHAMTKGYEVRVPADLKRRHAFTLAGDPISNTLFQVMGGVAPKQLTIPEILPALSSGSVDFIIAPCLAAEQLQWASLLDHIDTASAGVAIGAFVLSTAKLASMPADLRALATESGDSANTAARQYVRDQDAMAFARLKARMTAYEPTQAEQEQWRVVFVEAGRRLRGTTFDPKMLDMAVKLAGVKL